MASNQVMFKRQQAISKIVKILKEKQDIDEKNLIYDIAAEFNVCNKTANDFLQTAKSKRNMIEQQEIEQEAFTEEELLQAEELEKKSIINREIAVIHQLIHAKRLKRLAKELSEGKINMQEITKELTNNCDYETAKSQYYEQIPEGTQI